MVLWVCVCASYSNPGLVLVGEGRGEHVPQDVLLLRHHRGRGHFHAEEEEGLTSSLSKHVCANLDVVLGPLS